MNGFEPCSLISRWTKALLELAGFGGPKMAPDAMYEIDLYVTRNRHREMEIHTQT